MPHAKSLRRTFEGQGIRPAKGLGQNFLVDPTVIRRIVDAVHVLPGDNVLEIGPGTGALTVPLAEAGAALTAIEVDYRLEPLLEAAVPPSVRLVFSDALTLNWAEVSPGPLEGTTIVSNLPYAITSPILVKLLSRPFRRAVVMVQSEVADRLLAPPGSKDRGSLSLLREAHAEGQRLFEVRPESFFPRPKVASAVLELRHRPFSLHPRTEEVWKGLFTYRRKTLRRGLREAFPVTAEEAVHILGESELPEMARPEDLTLDEFNRLALNIFGTE